VRDARIDERARQAILRLADGPSDDRVRALAFVAAVKTGRLAEIIGDDAPYWTDRVDRLSYDKPVEDAGVAVVPAAGSDGDEGRAVVVFATRRLGSEPELLDEAIRHAVDGGIGAFVEGLNEVGELRETGGDADAESWDWRCALICAACALGVDTACAACQECSGTVQPPVLR
jgi:hypothetical protein